MLAAILKRVSRFFVHSRHVHRRQAGVSSLSEVVNLIDRFIDDGLSYPLEWDDFVSWENASPGIEKIRVEVAALERKFFSADKVARDEALDELVRIRNRVAAILGTSVR